MLSTSLLVAAILGLITAGAAIALIQGRRRAAAVQAAKHRCIETYEPFLAALGELRDHPLRRGNDTQYVAIPWSLGAASATVDEHRRALIHLHRTVINWEPGDAFVQLLVFETIPQEPTADLMEASMKALRDYVWPVGTTFEEDLAAARGRIRSRAAAATG